MTRVVFWVPLKNLSPEQRQRRVEGGCHHDYYADLYEFIPASEIEKRWGKESCARL